MTDWGPQSTEPAGAPSPFDKHSDTVSAQATNSEAGVPDLMAAFIRRAPIHMQLQAVVLRHIGNAQDFLLIHHPAVMGIFQTDKAGDGKMGVVGLDRCFNIGCIQPTGFIGFQVKG